MGSAEENIVLPLDESLGVYLTRVGRGSNTEIKIFDRGDFYSVHYNNAIFIANDFLKSPEAIKYLGKDKVPGVAISKLNYEALMRELLLVKQYRVELHAKVGSSWKKIAKGSPGNLSQFEEVLFSNYEMSDSSGVVSLHVTASGGNYTVSLVCADVLMKQLLFSELNDTEQFCALEALLVQISPKEIIFSNPETSSEYGKLSQMFKRLKVLVVSQKLIDFQAEKGKSSLSKLILKEDGITSKMASSDGVMGCLASLVKYLELFSDESNMNSYELSEVSPNVHMRLDGAAFAGLNVMPSHPTEPIFSSLWGILNHCFTPQGQRLLSNWLKQPLLDTNKIKERHDIVEAFVEDGELRQNLSVALKRIPDFFRIAKKVQRGRGSLQDCYKLYMAIKQIPVILDALCKYSGSFETTLNCAFITSLRELEQDFGTYSDLVETTVDLDKCDRGEFVIKHSFDEDLSELRSQLDSLEEKIDIEFNRIARMLNAEKGKGVKLDITTTYGHCCRVTRKDEKGLRNNKSLMILQTKKDGVSFTSSNLKGLSADFRITQKNYEEVQSGIVGEVLKVAAGYTEPLINLNHVIALMDCLLSFSLASITAPIPFVRPAVLEKGTGVINLVGSRHPCVEGNDDITFISNDVKLNKTDSSFLIITGPNMGGKSTYIRQIGVTSVLTQIGCFVPCHSAEISIVSSIFARVGATDSQAKGVSTFMAEMLETSAILATADKDSLIIIDELGRGTSTYDGFGLAWAISNHIIEKVECLAVFATHFHELTNLANVQKSVQNFHVSALVQEDALTLLYKVTPGPCDQSFGVHVAKLAQFPDSVIKSATAKAAELDQFKFVPQACLNLNEHSDFVVANKLIDELLKALYSSYTSGKRGVELREVVDNFIADNSEQIQANTILSSIISKVSNQIPVNGA